MGFVNQGDFAQIAFPLGRFFGQDMTMHRFAPSQLSCSGFFSLFAAERFVFILGIFYLQ